MGVIFHMDAPEDEEARQERKINGTYHLCN